jgi:hypothetical protein
MRASWSPASSGEEQFELDRHVEAWADTLCIAAGLPPVTPGVTQLRPPQHRQQPRQPRPRHRP